MSEVRAVRSTADFEVDDVLMCPHGVLAFVTKIIDDQHWQSTMIFANEDSPENHADCAWRVEFSNSERIAERMALKKERDCGEE
jgi:hypothetical protein